MDGENRLITAHIIRRRMSSESLRTAGHITRRMTGEKCRTTEAPARTEGK